MEDITYTIIAWALAGGIGGYLLGRWDRRNIAGPREPILRRNFNWARSDLRIPEPTAKDTPVRKVTDWQGAADLNLEDRTLTFHVQGGDGFERDMMYTSHQVMRLFKCDTPKHAEWHGDHNEFSRLMAVAKHYGWVIPEGKGRVWSIPFGTRERRLRILAAWMTCDTLPRPA